IVEKIENMHLSYYEISFPDVRQLKDKAREIEIKSKRKGIKIYSLHSLEKRKKYTDMKDIEKDMLVLNLVTQPDNLLIKSKITAYNALVEKSKESKKGVTYTVTLPPSYLLKNIDLYKVWLAVNDQGMAQMEKIEKESLYPKKNRLQIQFQFTEDKKQKAKEKDTETAEIETFFVLVNKTAEPARASVHGLELYEEDPELAQMVKKKLAAKKRKGGKTINAEELKRILQGVADYCDRLKQSAFHFYCLEKILETRKPLTDAELQDPHIDEVSMRTKASTALDQIRTKAYSKVNSYVFGYRLRKQGNKINEERDYISSTDNVRVNRAQVIMTNAFFTEKAIFAPITILDRSRQDNYDFQFARYDELNGRNAVVIEATPKNPRETDTIYGSIWIDSEDFSVMKIEADPKSIRGYKKLKELSRKLRTRLHLSLVSEFDEIRQGIRFPTRVKMMEKYKGGRIISGYRGPQGWERTITEFIYSDYRFFSVQTDVTVQ
ncbi:MAG: hypothetical protein JSV88_29165, partial [Candidatus Aminicenantes bacterium]